MEKAQTGTVHNLESSSTVSSVNKIDIDELSKEKEEELLFGAEEDGEDEDTLSDDSLRLRLSDDDEIEREDATNIAELKSQSKTADQPILDTIIEKTLCSDVQQTVEIVSKPDDDKATQDEHNIAVNIPENSALLLDEYTSENKRIEVNTHNLENTSATVNESNESNEKCTLKSSKDLIITDVSDECSIAVSEQHIGLENDNLSLNNCIQTNNPRNTELKIQNGENLKETASNSKEVIPTDTCELKNKLDINTDSNSSFIDSITDKTSNSDKLSTAIISNSNGNNLENEIIDKHITDGKDDQLLNCSQDDLKNDSDVDLVKFDNSNESLLSKDTISHKNKNKSLELVDTTENKNVSNMSKITEKLTNTSLIENQNSSFNVKDNMEITIKDDYDIDKSESKIVDKKSSILQNILLASSDVDDSNNKSGIKNDHTVMPRRKRIRKSVDTVQDCEDNQGRKYFNIKSKIWHANFCNKR